MKKLVQILAVTTLAFALSTAYYARALQLQRSKTAGIASATWAPAAPGAPVAPGPVASIAPPGASIQEDPEIRATALRQRLARFKDPAQRTQIVARNRESLAIGWKPSAASMQLPSHELDRLLDNLADQAARFDQRRLECQIDPDCDLQALNITLKEAARQNLAHVLGPDGLAKRDAYVDSIPERVYIEELRKALPPDHALSDAQAERLVMALADERHRLVERAAQMGTKVQVSGAGFTVQEIQGDVAPRPFGPSNKELTKDFNNRLRNRASQNLSREQLAEFTKLQKTRLENSAFMEMLLKLGQKQSP